jgi:hypothetical protein
VLFGKASKTQRATWNLCLTGCGADALALTGLLFENLVDLKYVSRAPVHRPRRFIQFEQVDKLFSVQKVLKRPRLPKGVRKDYRRIEAELSTATRGFIKKFRDKRYQRAGWSGRSIRERAKSVGQDFEYDRFYSIVCAFKHTSPSSASGTMLQHDDGVDMIFGPSSIGVLDAAVHSALLYLGIAAEVQQVFGISVQPTTHAIQLKLLDAFQSVSAG